MTSIKFGSTLVVSKPVAEELNQALKEEGKQCRVLPYKGGNKSLHDIAVIVEVKKKDLLDLYEKRLPLESEAASSEMNESTSSTATKKEPDLNGALKFFVDKMAMFYVPRPPSPQPAENSNEPRSEKTGQSKPEDKQSASGSKKKEPRKTWTNFDKPEATGA